MAKHLAQDAHAHTVHVASQELAAAAGRVRVRAAARRRPHRQLVHAHHVQVYR